MSNGAFAKIEAGQKLLTFAPLLAILRAGTLERSFAGRRPGRPCIDEQVQAVIRRMAMENRLWGAPRIHGKLLKLGTPSQNARCRVICPTDAGLRHRRGVHTSRTTSATWHALRRGVIGTSRAMTRRGRAWLYHAELARPLKSLSGRLNLLSNHHDSMLVGRANY